MLIYHCQCYRTLCCYSRIFYFYSYIDLYLQFEVFETKEHTQPFAYARPWHCRHCLLFPMLKSGVRTLGHEFSIVTSDKWNVVESDIAHRQTHREREREREGENGEKEIHFHRVRAICRCMRWLVFVLWRTHTHAHDFRFINSTWALESILS